jgi:hypothetical protein
MDLLKSQVESVTLDLCLQLIRDDPLGTTQSKSTLRDCVTLATRTRNEGLAFLTKTLPKLGKALDLGLVSTSFSLPREFKHSHESRCRPAFMQAYFKLVFDGDGALREDACPIAIKHLRQVLFFAYKLELPYQEDQISQVIENFVRTDEEIGLIDYAEDYSLLELSARITKNIFSDFDPKDIRPKHGPGAVATGERLEEKWEFSRLYNSIHQVFPYYDYFMVGGGRELLDRLGWYKQLERHESGVAKVVLVPKDSRGPRLISCEPLEYQWIQQGLGRKMVSHLESHRLTKGQINFTRQEINQQLALRSSINGEYATLDLKDASDRVGLQLVRRIFCHVPELLRALEACRTTATLLPDGSIMELKKFAPMGSALCFPVEAYCFWVLMVAATVLDTRLPLRRVGERVFVYGDDIIVPVTWAPRCMRALEHVGLVVNKQKSCITGSFRESCGTDAFRGVYVTPARLRKPWTGRRSDGSAYASYVSLANELGSRGYTNTSNAIWNLLENAYGKIPAGTSRSSYPSRIFHSPEEAEEYNSKLFQCRWNRNFQRSEFKVLSLKTRKVPSKIDGWTRLMRDLSSPLIDDPSVVVVPRSTQLRRGWAPV